MTTVAIHSRSQASLLVGVPSLSSPSLPGDPPRCCPATTEGLSFERSCCLVDNRHHAQGLPLAVLLLSPTCGTTLQECCQRLGARYPAAWRRRRVATFGDPCLAVAEVGAVCAVLPITCTEKKHRSKRGAPLSLPSPTLWPHSSLVRLLLKSFCCLPWGGATAASCCQGQAVRTCPGDLEVCRRAASGTCCGCLEGATLEPCLLCYVPIFGENPLGGATKSRRIIPSVCCCQRKAAVLFRQGKEKRRPRRCRPVTLNLFEERNCRYLANTNFVASCPMYFASPREFHTAAVKERTCTGGRSADVSVKGKLAHLAVLGPHSSLELKARESCTAGARWKE